MLAITNPNRTPPKAFRYHQPETGRRFQSISYSAIIDEIAIHRARASLDLSPGWQERVDDEMCRQNGWSGGICHEIREGPHEITSGDVKNFLHVLGNVMASGGSLVPQEEAERRAEICAGCPKNMDVPGCFGMCPGSVAKSLMRFAAAFQGRILHTSRDADLKSCGVCGCANAAQVHVSLETLSRVKGDYVFPDHCWKR